MHSEVCDLFAEEETKLFRITAWHKLLTVDGEEIYCQNIYTLDEILPANKLKGFIFLDVARKYFKRGIYIVDMKSVTKEEFDSAEVDWEQTID